MIDRRMINLQIVAPFLPTICLGTLTPITTSLSPFTNVSKSTICGTILTTKMKDPVLIQVLVLMSGRPNGWMELVTMLHCWRNFPWCIDRLL